MHDSDDGSTVDLRSLYGRRFSGESAGRHALWQVLCEDFFQKWVPADGSVLDVAAGGCEFVNHIQARRKVAVDLNPAVVEAAGPDVTVHVQPSDRMTGVADGSMDRVFVSNFFEHISRESILATLIEIRRVLKPSGRLLILQPNIRFCAKDYWMFFDHVTPVDDRAMAEALTMTGFRLVHSVPRFLPFTTKSRLPQRPWMVRWYLRFPPLWHLLGAQSFLVAEPAS